MIGKRKLRAARALAILLAAALLAASAGCSSAGSSKASYSGTAQTADSARGLGGTSSQQASSASAEKAASSSRKVIRSASLQLQTREYERTLSELGSLVDRFGGYIQSSRNEYGGLSASAGASRSRSSTLQARIPSAKLDAFLSGAGKTGAVVSREVDGQDVTQSYYDTETRLKTLRAEQDRVLALLSRASGMADILTIEDKLSDLQNQIEQLTGELKKWDDLVDLSTVSIAVTEVRSYTGAPSSFGAQALSTLTASLRALGNTFRVIALVLVAVLPFAAVFATIFLLLFLLHKRGRLPRRRGSKGRRGGPGSGPVAGGGK